MPSKWRNDTTQHMVSAIELLGAFDGDHITDIFHHANHFLFSHGVGTDGTDIAIGHIVTTLAEFYFTPHSGNHFTEMLTSSVSCFSKCKTKRKAVFLPIPGSLANSFTAFSKREEENCMKQR